MPKARSDDRRGFVWTEPVTGYDLWAETYDGDPNPLISVEEPIVRELIGDPRGMRVLDVGCGTGRHTVWLAERGAEVVGIDSSPGMLARARARLPESARVTLLQGQVADLALQPGAFDLIVCALTLCHCPDLVHEINAMARSLRAGGRLVLSDIHPVWPESGHDYTEFFDRSGREYRMRCFAHPVEEVHRMLRDEGLSVEQVREPRIDALLVQRFPSLGEIVLAASRTV